MLYFEDARIEFFGVPLAYLPFMSAPDPTVTRKSGFLFPNVTYSIDLYGWRSKSLTSGRCTPSSDLTTSADIDQEAEGELFRGRLAPTPDGGLVLDQGRRHFPSRPRLLCQPRRS